MTEVFLIIVVMGSIWGWGRGKGWGWVGMGVLGFQLISAQGSTKLSNCTFAQLPYFSRSLAEKFEYSLIYT